MGVDAIDSNSLRALDTVRTSSPPNPGVVRTRAQDVRDPAGAAQETRPETTGVPRRLGGQPSLPPHTRLRVDVETNQIVAQVLDENNEVIRQIPPEALLDLATRFSRLEGLLFNRES